MMTGNRHGTTDTDSTPLIASLVASLKWNERQSTWQLNPLGQVMQLVGSRVQVRVALIALFVLVYVCLLEWSVVDLYSGNHWWGVGAEPAADGRSVAIWVQPNGPAWDQGLRAGDIIVRPAADTEDLNTAAQLEVLRPADDRAFTLEQTSLAKDTIYRSGVMLVISAFFVLSGATVFLKAKSRTQARFFVALCFAAALTFLSVPAGSRGFPWAIHLTYIGSVGTSLAFALFMAVFPISRIERSVPVKLVIGGLICICVLAVSSYGATASGVLPTEFFVVVERLGLLSIGGGLTFGLVCMLGGYSRLGNARARQQLRIAVGGTALGVLPFVGLSLLPKIVQPNESFVVPPVMTVLGLAFTPLAFGYAILRHQLIGSDVVIRRSIIHLAATLVITVGYLLLISIGQPLLTSVVGRPSAVTPWLAAIIVALAMDPIRHRTQDVVERVFFSDIRAYRKALDAPSASVAALLSTEKLIQLLTGTIDTALGAVRLDLFVYDRESGEYQLLWSSQGLPGQVDHLPADCWLATRTKSAARATLLDDLSEIVQPDARVLVPLRSAGSLVAVVVLGPRSDGEQYSGSDLEFLDEVAARYAVALENSVLHETVRRQADSDPLTGLCNHRYGLDRLASEIALAQSAGQWLSVLMIDVNSFKYFNDCFGHTIGDDVLRRVADVLRSHCRQSDVLVRYGGDEFLVILPNTNREGALALADRLCASVQGISFNIGSGPSVAVTIAAGASLMPDDGVEPLSLIAAADVTLYKKKREGTLVGDTLPDITEIPSVALRGLFGAITEKDGYVADHSERAALWAVRVGAELGLSDRDLYILRVAGLLHDIGKLGVDERILNKPGALTPEERRLIEDHVELGVRLLNLISDIPNAVEITQIVSHHHERWDGRGYPHGLKHEETSLSGRILGAADAYSAMTTDRPYRSRLTKVEAIERLRRDAGHQFDPTVVDAFVRVLEQEGAPVFSGQRSTEAPPI